MFCFLMVELVKNIELSLLEPTKCKLEQLDKLYSEYLACGDILPPLKGCGLLNLSWNDILNPRY